MAKENGVAAATKVTKTDLLKIPVELVDIDESKNTREDYGDLEEEAATIIEHGILTPTRGYKTGDRYFVVQGNRRVKAARLAAENGAKGIVVPMVTIGGEGNKSDERYLLETAIGNRSKSLTPLELAKTVARFKEITGLKNKEVGIKLGQSEAYVGRLLKLDAAPEEFKQLIRDGKISGTSAQNIIRENRVEEILEQSKNGGEINLGLGADVIKTDKGKEREKNKEETDSVNSFKEFGKFAVYANPKKMSTEKKWSDREVFNYLVKIQNNEIDRPDFDKKFKQDA